MSERILRAVTLRSSIIGEIRTAEFEGVEHIVVPVVALVEGVIQAMNAPYPELVLADRFAIAPSGWNGRPVFLNHPMEGGRPVSGNAPHVLETSFGKIFNTSTDPTRLLMEVWLDPEKAKTVSDEAFQLVSRIQKNKDIVEISTGAFIVLEDKTGRWNGIKYNGVWDIIIPDHLALLPEGSVGACSVEMGCGVRAAGAYQVTKSGLRPLYLLESKMEPKTDEFRTLRDIPQAERDKMSAKDFAGPNRSFPISEPDDVSAAASSLGRAKGNTDAIKKKIIAIAYRKGTDFVAKLPDDWKKKADQKNASGIGARILAFLGLAGVEDMSDQDVRDELREALLEKEPAMKYGGDIIAVYSALGQFIYMLWENDGYCYYRRDYTMSADGEPTVADTRVEVERVVSFEPVEADEEGDLTVAVSRVIALAGKRNSTKDQKLVQTLHDSSVSLGADCAGMKAASGTKGCGCGNSAVTAATEPVPAQW